MTMRKKLLITIACLSVILCALVTGTIAWLTDNTQSIVNEFTPSDIDVELVETKFEKKMVPGKTMDKTATVTVTNDIACYVFIKVDESAVLDTYIAYSVDDTIWTPVSGQTGVYYKAIETTGTASFTVLGAGSETINGVGCSWGANKVLVKPTVTKQQMQDLNVAGAVQPTLTFTAYVCQMENGDTNFTPAEAWAIAKPATN